MEGPRSQRLFLVIGCGSIGKRHMNNLLAMNPGGVLAFDIRADRRREVGSLFNVEILDDLEEAWTRNPDVALVTTDTAMHVPLALRAAEHGCHLFIEKPLSDNLEDVDKLLDVVKKRNLVTLVGCNMRFHPGLLAVKKLLDQEAIGRVIAARAEVGQYLPDWHPWEDYRESYSAKRDRGGGVILDAVHEIDYLRWMLGEVEAVACFAGKISDLEIETEDTAAILLRFASGAIGQTHMDYVQRAYSRNCHVIGQEGTIRWNYNSSETRWYSSMTRKWKVIANPPGWEPSAMYLDEMRHFLRCLEGEERPALDVFEAKRDLEVALAAKASASSGKVILLRGG